MAQPAQANPFAAPPAAGAPPPGDPNMQQQQPIQTGNPFGGFAAAPAPAQPSDPFSAAPTMQMPNGTGAIVPPQQHPPPIQVQPSPQKQQQAPFQSSDPFGAPQAQAPGPIGGSVVAAPPQQQQQQAPPMQTQPPPQQSQQVQAPFHASDPFAAPPVLAPAPVSGSSVASPPQPQQPPQPNLQPPPQQQQAQASFQSQDPFAAPPSDVPVANGGVRAVSPPQQQPVPQQQQPQPQLAVQQQQGMQQPPQFQQQQGMQQQPPQQGMAASPPQFGGQQQFPPQQQVPVQAQPGQQPVDPFSSALVPSAQPANPYAQSVVQQPGTQPAAQQQQPGNPFGGQAMVPAAQSQQQSQWAVAGAAPVAAANPFDPFAPPPPPAPAPAPPPQQSTELVPAGQQANYQAPDFPFDPDNVQQAPAQQEKPPEASGSVGPPVNEVNAIHGHGAHSVVSEPETTLTRRSDDHGYSGGGEMVVHQPQVNLQNKYSKELARNAPPGCAPLPKGELVTKSGYILSRISFRTILMKKWKQTYWVQYGRHTMLWFRSETQFNEWLSNPYLSQAQRNFLVKLAINFVHDLYKPNVRGYQVTQAHSKPYGRKMVRQFKLERWMDYGPTIAAAFGSVDTREVDVLRQTIIDCMRNTPLENGIRATGAVRQDHGQEHHNNQSEQRFSYDDHQPPRGQPYEMSNARLDGDGYDRSSGPVERSVSAPVGGRSVVSENPNDFLSDQRASGFDDTASYGGYSSGQYQNYSQAPSQRQAHPQYAYR